MKNQYGKQYSLAQIIYRLICNENEGFTDYQKLTLKNDEGFDISNDVSLLDLDAVHSSQLPSLPSIVFLRCEGPAMTAHSLVQNLAELYSRSRHSNYFNNECVLSRDEVALTRPSVTHIDLASLVRQSPEDAIRSLNAQLDHKQGATILITGLSALSEVVSYKPKKGMQSLSPVFLRAGLIRALKDKSRGSMIVLSDTDQAMRDFCQSEALSHFYESVFAQPEKAFSRFQYLQHFIEAPKDQEMMRNALRGLGPKDWAFVIQEFDKDIKPLLIGEPDFNDLIKTRIGIPKYVGTDLLFYTMKLFDDHHFTLTKEAKHQFMLYQVKMSMAYGGKGYGKEADSPAQTNKEAELFSAEVIVCALDRLLSDIEDSGEMVDLYNALVMDRYDLSPIRRVIIEQDVHNAAKSLRGLNLTGRKMFPLAPVGKTPKP